MKGELVGFNVLLATALGDEALGERGSHVYKIYEKGTRVHGAGLLRTLVVKDEKGQVPVITNISETSPAKIVSLLKMRWRQENSFKYLSDHYGIEQLIQHDADYFKDQRLMDNPKRKNLREKLEGLRKEDRCEGSGARTSLEE